MIRARVHLFAIASVLLCAGGLARAAEECTTARCQNPTKIREMRTAIAAECDCAGATNPSRYMACVKRVVSQGVAAGAFPRTCKGAVTKCEARLGCGRGIRPFRTVQRIFDQANCSLPTCHSAIARQGGLVLDSEDVSYANLVNRPVTYADPAASGALLVVPGDPDASFLIRKLKGTAPGSQMPQGAPPLSKGTIKLIEKWIKRGARATADECPPGRGKRGKKACNDRPVESGSFTWAPQEPLEPPEAAGVPGFQMYTPPRDVAAGTEWELCYAFKNIPWQEYGLRTGYAPGETPVIKQQTYRMHEGSHHLLLYAYFGPNPQDWADGYFPCNAGQCEAGNPNDCPKDTGSFMLPIGGTQVAGTRYDVKYPDGVGIPVLSPDMVLIANLHYTNPFSPPQPIYGESWLNIYFYRPGEFKALLNGIFAVNFQDLFVEPYQTRTISRIWNPRDIVSRQPADAAVFQLFGHMHKRGTLFQIDLVKDGKCSSSGALCGNDNDCACRRNQSGCRPQQTCVRGPAAEDSTIYYTTSWDHAPVVDYQWPYLRVKPDEGLRWTCTHVNGVEGDPARPPKRCHEGCDSCGWDDASRTCIFRRGVGQGFQDSLRVYQEGEPMPIVFGELADDDMCNMFGYFLRYDDLALLPRPVTASSSTR